MSPRTIEKIVRFFSWLEGMLQKRPSEVKAVIILLGCFWATNFLPMATQYYEEHPWESTLQSTVSGGHVVESKFSDPNSAEALNWAMKNRIPTYKDEPPAWKTEGVRNFALKRLGWLLVFYLRCMPLIALLYLSRMAGRKGILATILANKLRFVLAIVGWPVMIFKYPHNVVREVIVTAELSRLKSPFAGLTKREQEIVREVASDKVQFKTWRAGFRLANAGSLQRGFALALAITILMILIAPPLARSGVNALAKGCEKNRGSTVVVGVMFTLPVLGGADQTQQDSSGVAILTRGFMLVIPLALRFIIEPLREAIIRGPVRDHSPIPKLSPVLVLR